MTRKKKSLESRPVALAGAVAVILFIALFRFERVGPLDFWSWLAANIIIVVALGFFVDKGYARRLAEDLRTDVFQKVLIGAASAGALYAVFAVGRVAALRIFPFAGSEIGRVYALKAGNSALRIGLLISLVIGPGEELFWRGFFQERVGATIRPGSGFVMAALIYTTVHLASGNIMLVVAAAVCAVFWGWLYLTFRSPLLNVVSHTVWDLLVFLVLPF